MPAGAGRAGGDLIRDPLGARLVQGGFLHDSRGHLRHAAPPPPLASRRIPRREGLLQRIAPAVAVACLPPAPLHTLPVPAASAPCRQSHPAHGLCRPLLSPSCVSPMTHLNITYHDLPQAQGARFPDEAAVLPHACKRTRRLAHAPCATSSMDGGGKGGREAREGGGQAGGLRCAEDLGHPQAVVVGAGLARVCRQVLGREALAVGAVVVVARPRLLVLDRRLIPPPAAAACVAALRSVCWRLRAAGVVLRRAALVL